MAKQGVTGKGQEPAGEAPHTGGLRAALKSSGAENKDSNRATDPLVRGRTYPDPVTVFSFSPVSLETILQDGLIVVDTNALLLPYGTGRSSLNEIRRVYQQLTEDKRLRIPGQVAREFADLRAEKLKNLFYLVSQKQDLLLKEQEYPLLQDLKEYSEVRSAESAIATAHSEYRKLVGALLDRIAGWRWDDPVSAIYRTFFNSEAVVDLTLDRDDVLADLDYRNTHKIPPGYKDSAKEDGGIGDLLIWKTILSIGEREQKHLAFITGEEKSDWWHRSNNRILYPRFELVDEYRRASNGKSFQMASFAELLKVRKAPADVVAEVQREEASLDHVSEGIVRRISTPEEAEKSVFRWLESLHPEALIEIARAGYPDIILRTDKRVEGYEVKYLETLAGASFRVKQALNRARAFNAASDLSLTLVFVLRSGIEASLLFRNIRDIQRIDCSCRMLVGTISGSGVFSLVDSIDPGDLGKPPNSDRS